MAPDVRDDIELLSLTEYAEAIADDLKSQIQYTYSHSEYYAALLDSHDCDVDAFSSPEDLTSYPFTEKDELRKSQEENPPFGRHQACPTKRIKRIYSSSGTTGNPTIIGLTKSDLDIWTDNGARTTYAQGVRPADFVFGAYPAGPFVAGVQYDAHRKADTTLIPLGPGNTDRIIHLLTYGCGNVLTGTPSYAEYFAEEVVRRGLEPDTLGIDRILVGGEPGASRIRDEIEETFGCKLLESMGTGDIALSIWGECEMQNGMHFTGQNSVYPELIDPDTGERIEMVPGTSGELVYTSLNRECIPLIRFRSREHVVVLDDECECGRGTPLIRCVGRTDDMFSVRGVNVFPSSVADVVDDYDHPTGKIRILLDNESDTVDTDVVISVEVDDADLASEGLAADIQAVIRERLKFTAPVELVEHGTIERSEYKKGIVEYTS